MDVTVSQTSNLQSFSDAHKVLTLHWVQHLCSGWASIYYNYYIYYVIFLSLVALKRLVSLIRRLVACSARIVVDTQTDRQTDTQTKYCNPCCSCAPRVTGYSRVRSGITSGNCGFRARRLREYSYIMYMVENGNMNQLYF